MNVTDTLGRTPLLAAASEGKWDVCQQLAEKGCNVNATDIQVSNKNPTPVSFPMFPTTSKIQFK